MPDASKQTASLPHAKPSRAPALTAREAVLVAEIVQRVGLLLKAEPSRTRLVDAATVADALGISRDWVYAHAQELGGARVGAGPRGRLRFDLNRALAAWRSRPVGDLERAASEASTELPRRSGKRPREDAGLLPVRGRTARVTDAGRL